MGQRRRLALSRQQDCAVTAWEKHVARPFIAGGCDTTCWHADLGGLLSSSFIKLDHRSQLVVV